MANDTPSPEPVYRYHRTGFTFEVFPNRIEVAERKALSTKRETIPIRKISSVTLQGLTKAHIELATDDGKKWKWLIGTDAEKARNAVVALL